MGKPSSRLLGKHARSLFIGKPVVLHRSSMARLAALRGGDLRCLSFTFMAIVLCCCVFLISLHPSQYPVSRLSMVDLPKDEVVRAQSIPALLPLTSRPASKAGSAGKEGKKNGKGEQKGGKNDKKANKAKWIKDELPKKARGGVSSNGTKPISNTEIKDLTNATTSQTAPSKDLINATSTSPQSAPLALKPSEDHAIPKSSPTLSKPESPNPHAAQKQRNTRQANTTFSNLNRAPLKKFVSPFIEAKSSQQTADKKIVTWYKPVDVRALHRKKKALDNCPSRSRCKVVYPLPDGVVADAIVFDGVDKRGMPPRRADDNQVFVFHDTKPPSIPLAGVWPTAWNSVFNWTWTFRRDSDIWQPFGLLKKARRVRGIEYFETLAKVKTRAVAWMPQTCPNAATSSKRSEFVKELGRYVRIAEFGTCSNISCAKTGAAGSCSETLTKKFFFLLAVEDDICTDYVTEVFYRAWQEGTHVVPVVRGGADYGAFFPEGTYVDADWFDNVKELAGFMAELMANRQTYSQLLWRKSHWVRASKHMDDVSLCKLCDMLHDVPSNRKHYPDIRRWFEKDVCRTPRPF